MKFAKARLGISEIAEALKMDPQTIRILIQQGLVPYGKAVKMPGSTRYMYLVNPKEFYEYTGVALREGLKDG